MFCLMPVDAPVSIPFRSNVSFVATSSLLVRVVTVTADTAQIELIASPRNPKDFTPDTSSNDEIFDV